MNNTGCVAQHAHSKEPAVRTHKIVAHGSSTSRQYNKPQQYTRKAPVRGKEEAQAKGTSRKGAARTRAGCPAAARAVPAACRGCTRARCKPWRPVGPRTRQFKSTHVMMPIHKSATGPGPRRSTCACWMAYWCPSREVRNAHNSMPRPHDRNTRTHHCERSHVMMATQ